MERYPDLSAVISVDNANLVCGCKTTLGAKTASGKDKTAIALGNLNGNARM